MRFRRTFALLTSLTMLHLTVASADGACAPHGATEHHVTMSAGHAMPMHGDAMPGADGTSMLAETGVPVAASDTTPCEIPAQQNCCAALVGCGVAGAIASAGQLVAATVLPTTRVREALHDAPASFAQAPEPPPPKA